MNKRLFTNSFVYVISDVLNKSIPFMMIPILTRYLTPDDYGLVSIFIVIVSIFSIFTGLNIHGAINVNFFKMDKEVLKNFIGNCIIILNVSTLIIMFITLLTYLFFSEKFYLTLDLIILAIFLAFSQFLTTINLLLWIAEERPKEYGIYQIIQTLIITGLTIIFIIGFGMKWEGQILAMSIGTFTFSMLSIFFIIKRGYLISTPNIYHIKDALKFGIPLIPHTLSGLAKNGADRLIIMSLLGATITGIYSVGYQIAMVIGVLATAFNKAWSPYLFKVLSSEPTYSEKLKIVKFSYLYFIGILLFSIIFAYLVELVLPYFVGTSYLDASKIIIYLSIAFAFDGMYYMITNYIFYVKKTHLLSYVTFLSSLIHIALFYYFIKINSIVGAAQANLISFLLTFLVVWYLSHKVYPMPWLKIFKLRGMKVE